MLNPRPHLTPDRPYPAEPEEWRPIIGFEGFYEVSSLGRVRSFDRYVPAKRHGRLHAMFVAGQVMKTSIGYAGYPRVRLCAFGVHTDARVHRLVCEAFHGPCPPDHETAHLDGNRANPRASNLAWVTHAENVSHTIVHGTRVNGERVKSSKLTPQDVREIRKALLEGEPQASIGRRFGVRQEAISAIYRGKVWRHVP